MTAAHRQRRIVTFIGSMCCRYRGQMQLAKAGHGQGAICLVPAEEPDLIALWDERRMRAGKPPLSSERRPNRPVNTDPGFWHWAVDQGDEVVVVCKPDGSLGAGTVDELRYAVGIGKLVRWA